jgi:hypothetical protein
MESPRMWCPHCEASTINKVLPGKGTMKSRSIMINQKLITFIYIRRRECNTCHATWDSIEVDYNLLLELIAFYEACVGLKGVIDETNTVVDTLTEVAEKLNDCKDSLRVRYDQIKEEDRVEVVDAEHEYVGRRGRILKIDETSNSATVYLSGVELNRGGIQVEVPLEHLRKLRKYLS